MSYTCFCSSAPVLEQLLQGQWWQQRVGTESWVFVLVLFSRTYLLGIFNTPQKKREEFAGHSHMEFALQHMGANLCSKQATNYLVLTCSTCLASSSVLYGGQRYFLLFMMLCDISFLFVLLLSGYDDSPSN